jgi:hypothetical protein
MEERTGFPTAQSLRKMIATHVRATSEKCLNIIGQRLWDLQWSGQISFHDLPFPEESEKDRLIVSRMSEKDVRRVVALVQDHLDDCGYEHDFEVQKYEEHPHFRIYYWIDLQDGDGSSSDGGDEDSDELEPQSTDVFSAMDLLHLTPSEGGSVDLAGVDLAGEDEEGPRTQESPVDFFLD